MNPLTAFFLSGAQAAGKALAGGSSTAASAGAGVAATAATAIEGGMAVAKVGAQIAKGAAGQGAEFARGLGESATKPLKEFATLFAVNAALVLLALLGLWLIVRKS